MSRTPFEEDIYEFDDVLSITKGEDVARNRTYTLDENGVPVRTRGRNPARQDNVVRLPKVLVGQSRFESGPDVAAMSRDRRVRLTGVAGAAGVAGREMDRTDWDRERSKLTGPRQPQKEIAILPDKFKPAHHVPQTGSHRRPADYIRAPVSTGESHVVSEMSRAMYKQPYADGGITQTGIHRRPADYIRVPTSTGEGHVVSEMSRAKYQSSYPNEGLTQTHPAYQQQASKDRDVEDFTGRVDVYEGQDLLAPYSPLPPSIPSQSKSYNETPYVPAPPTAKQAENQSYSKTRRQLKYRNQSVQPEAPVYRPPAAVKQETIKPTSPASDFIDDFDREVKEAIEMEKKFAALNEKMKKLKKECDSFGDRKRAAMLDEDVDKFLDDLDEMLEAESSPRPNSVAMANCNIAGCTSPMRMPKEAMVPHLSKEPLKQWKGDVAKRGVGFKSKLKREEPRERHVAGSDAIPYRVRQRMNQHLNGGAPQL